MKVLHINCNYLTTSLHQTMVEHLENTNIESCVFAPTYDKNNAIISANDYVTVSECFKKWDRVFFEYKQKKIIKSVNQNYDITGFDCIHAYTLFSDGNCAMKLSNLYNIPYVVAVRSTDIYYFFKYRPWLKKLGIEIMESASAIFFLSEAYKEKVIEEIVPVSKRRDIRKKSIVMPNGIHDFWLENISVKNSSDVSKRLYKKQLNIVYAGRINKTKNIRTTLGAIDILKKRGFEVTFTVVGKIEDKSEYKRLLGQENVFYVEPQPKEKLIQIYRDNDFFVMPSRFETFGLVYAEAMSQGLPVVYTKGQGFDGHFENGVVGFSVNWKSESDVAEAIMTCASDYTRISNNCIEFVQRFNWSKICEEYEKLYVKVVNERK